MNEIIKNKLDKYKLIETHEFSHNGINIVLDVNQSNFYDVNETIVDIVKYKKKIIDKYATLEKKFTESEIESAITNLVEAKFLVDDIPEYEEIKIPKQKEVVNLVMNISQDCNLRCRYCFASTGHYKGERAFMEEEIAKKTLDWFVNQAVESKTLNLHLFGGEPLMNVDLVKFIVYYSKNIEEKFDKKIYINICTNGTILNDELLKLIKDNEIGMQISIDGPPEIHDKYRPTSDGGSSYKLIKENLGKLFEALNVNSIIPRATISPNDIEINKVVEHLLDIGFKSVFFIPAMGCNNFSIKLEDVDKVKEEYNLLTKKFIDHIREEKQYNVFPLITEIDAVGKGIRRIYGCGAGIGFASVDIHGDIYPCMRFTNRTEYRLGTVENGFDISQREKFFNRTVYNREKCKDCWARFLCGGACISIPTESGKNLEAYAEETCEVSKHIAKLSMYINAVLNREGLKFDKSQLEVNDFMRRRFQ